MYITGRPVHGLTKDALAFIDLYLTLGENAENFVPAFFIEKLTNFVKLCYQQPIDPAMQKTEIERALNDLKESIPGYVDVSLMLYPHEDSKAFIYQNKKLEFVKKLNYLIETEAVDGEKKSQAQNILNSHDFSVGTPPVTQKQIDYIYQLLLGDKAGELKKFRDVIGVNGDEEEAQWNYFLNVLDQMVIQSSHYTTTAERKDFLNQTELTINFKGLNGFIRTVVSGSADTAIKLIAEEVFSPSKVKVVDFVSEQDLYDKLSDDYTSVFVVKVKSMRRNIFNKRHWFPFLTRIVIVDDSVESVSTNTSLVFAFHNGIINTLNKIHTKKLGALANSQLNLRLILDKINTGSLERFRDLALAKIKDYENELLELKKDQLELTNNPDRDIVLFKFDEFSRQIIKDKYALTKLAGYIDLLLTTKDPKKLKEQNIDLIHEFEERTRQYFYADFKDIYIATINEGGGRNQIKTYGEWLLQRPLKKVDPKIMEQCRVLLDILPNNYYRTLHNHFHKNFGLNLFLEKYKEFITKSENPADNTGRFANFLIDLGIKDQYDKRSQEHKNIIKGFISDLANLDKTSISDDVQMIIRDIMFHRDTSLRPYILYNKDLAWEYQDLFPVDRFDLNPFDLEIGNDAEGRIDFARLLVKLQRMKSTFQLFDDTGSLWDRFCENLTIIINDPANPSGFTNFNDEDLLSFLKFINSSKITLFLDEAYTDSVKSLDKEFPKWINISRYIINNISSLSNLSFVSSLSTTKNLGGTGIRLGSIIASKSKKAVIDYARTQNPPESCNTNSVYILVNIIEAGQLAKRIKDRVEERLAKNASIQHFKRFIAENIKSELSKYEENLKAKKNPGKEITRFSPFEGSPLHIALLEELVALDKLEVLKLPDDFIYKAQPFFRYYQEQLAKTLNAFRINKLFRDEAFKRMQLGRKVVAEVLEKNNYDQYARIVESDGSYLFNLQLTDLPSFQGLEKFALKLAEQRGIAIIPYRIGFLRFSLGDYLDGSEKSYAIFADEIRNAMCIFFKYWSAYYTRRKSDDYQGKTTEDILEEIFGTKSDSEFTNRILEDFTLVKDIKKVKQNSLKISKLDTLYLVFPEKSGMTINSIGESKNSVFEFYENIGKCADVRDFIRSMAFTKVYENLLPQIYSKIPQLSHLSFDTILARYGKSAILKYIDNKLSYQPQSYSLDDLDELDTMKEILIELEDILFSDSKFKIMAVDASKNVATDQQKLEGVNAILKKNIRELMIHFNLPFENPGIEPNIKEIVDATVEHFENITGIKVGVFGLTTYTEALIRKLRQNENFTSLSLSEKVIGYIQNILTDRIINHNQVNEKILFIYLLMQGDRFEKQLVKQVKSYSSYLENTEDEEVKLSIENYILNTLQEELNKILDEIFARKDLKINQKQLRTEVRAIGRLFIDIINKTRATEYYNRYTHRLIRFVETVFKTQNSSINEMIQHGISVYRNFDTGTDVLDTYNNGALKWIKDVMVKCGVISAEQSVQVHTRQVTDAKKREFAFHKIDIVDEEIALRQEKKKQAKNNENASPNEYIKNLATRPKAEFFGRRMLKFVEHLDAQDYRCKITDKGLFKELVIFQKSYLKYLSDNYRILGPDTIHLDEIKNFVPDVIQFLGAPEKVISFPKVGYFDLDGPNGKIKTLVTPLDLKGDYFGNVKKPRLTMINEKVKEMGGLPIHGSLFAIEEEDGGIFVVHVDGDSGVGKSEMLAAMQLKWMKKDLTGIRSIKLIAGDMFHIFPDKEGNLYGIGTEVGDFSRVTDFDPEYIKYYNSLFQSSSDSNVTDLNSRSTIGGLCDISMPYKIDLILSASNYAREEAGITRYDNPENFLFYRDSHGERKEKATSGDNPHFQRTLLRYPAKANVVSVLEKHGNYIDDIIDWDFEPGNGKFFLSSSYKMIDKIDVEEIVCQIFKGETFKKDKTRFTVADVKFDIIKNRFNVIAKDAEENTIEFLLDRAFFNGIFNALASTPGGQPFISEYGQVEGRQHMLNILRGKYGEKGQRIAFGVLSTDLGKTGREISGPQKAAEELRKMIQILRIENKQVINNKQKIRALIQEKYSHIFKSFRISTEIDRYNYMLWQIEQMRKAQFVRIDDMETRVDLSRLKGFNPLPSDHEFSPILVTPNINFELAAHYESYEQLMNLPNIPEFAGEFYRDCKNLYLATGCSEETIINNMIIQLLLVSGYIMVEDLNRGLITEKVNREVIAAAKSAVIRYYNERKENTEVSNKAETKVVKKKPGGKKK
ncbi:MAG: aminotransferase class I/II-fold pyridoxal phosphate-dependent enzyme [Bacteroidales bacterium]